MYSLTCGLPGKADTPRREEILQLSRDGRALGKEEKEKEIHYVARVLLLTVATRYYSH